MASLRNRTTLLVSVLCLSLAGCGSDGASDAVETDAVETDAVETESGVDPAYADLYAEAQEEGNFILYSAMVPATLEKVADEFTRTFPGVEMQFIRLTTAPMIERVSAEIEAENLLVDVVQASDAVWPQDLVDAGHVAELDIPELEEFPQEFRSNNHFFAHQVYLNAIAYNTDQLSGDEVPSTYQDVLAMGERASIVDPRGGGGNATVVFGTMKEFGVEFWNEVRESGTLIHASVATATPALVSGEISATIHTHSFPACEKAEGRPVEVVYPEQGVWATPQNTFVMEEARHPAAARLFAQWVASPEGQEFINNADCTYSPREDIERNPVLPPLSDLNLTVFTPEEWRDEFPPLQAEAAEAAGLPIE